MSKFSKKKDHLDRGPQPIYIYIFIFILFLVCHRNKIKSSCLYTLKPTLNEMSKANRKRKTYLITLMG